MKVRRLYFFVALATLALPSPCRPADTLGPEAEAYAPTSPPLARTIVGRVAVIDGNTLWFSRAAMKVRLAGIDVCALPQWAFDPKRYEKSPVLKPVPCGALAKAWLKRTTGDQEISCMPAKIDSDGAFIGYCFARGRDIGAEMIRFGWARVGYPSLPSYASWQRHAMAARSGMWAAYVLDMGEWRAKAIDQTLQRKPIADFNLMAERRLEISPPFIDARRRPAQADR
ncbi:thermonuclease family protein [Mesorhizobium sp. CO1-1-8]|uniref:thermonuclease family protein n=1 Tax=Mesorhizobium sp. CO1-1-8 TaxID=2876631 RepID=UPI001CD09FB5|nr:thermonuclease family protein [Mesorhizobium sp. CO1-1-8]MBZ9772611.1 thermonuclease family protein [Mesorhizobium sp. CO1-1-8]